VHALGDVLDDSMLEAADARRAVHELAAVVRKAMALSPADRYSGVAALADDLQDWLDGRPFRSGIGTMSARMQMQLRRWRWPLLTAASAAVALAVGGVVALQQAARAREEAAVAEANMQGMLDVLGELEAMDYTEPDPPLSKALVAAGERLQREHADQPAYLWRALGALGRTLYNRHRPDLAAPLLRATEEALARDPDATPRQRFDFAVMRYTADAPGDPKDIALQARRIGAFAARTDAENRLSEIATSAYGLSLYGKNAAALALVRAVDTAPAAVAAATRAVRDDYFVRRGDIEWRAGEFDAARASYARVDGSDPATAAVDAVQVLRMQALLALKDGDPAAATAAMAGAMQRAAGQDLRPGDAERLAMTRAPGRPGRGWRRCGTSDPRSGAGSLRVDAGRTASPCRSPQRALAAGGDPVAAWRMRGRRSRIGRWRRPARGAAGVADRANRSRMGPPSRGPALPRGSVIAGQRSADAAAVGAQRCGEGASRPSSVRAAATSSLRR
jgi:hypothetical protein